MKKAISILLALILIGSLSGCSTTEKKPAEEVENPVRESSAEEILETLGMTLNVPADAQNASYSIIDIEDVNPIAEAKFTRDNVEYTYRIRSAAAFEDVSGAYYDWKIVNQIEISYCSGEVRLIEGAEGICLWYDPVPGLMYSLYVNTGASEEGLLSMANELYIPAKDVE